MTILVKDLWNRDTFSALVLFSVYAAITGLVLLCTEQAFDRNPIYSFVKQIELHENIWAVTALMSSFGLLVAAKTPSAALRTLLLIACAAFWAIFGALVLLSFLVTDVISSAGLFQMAGSALCLVASSQSPVE